MIGSREKQNINSKPKKDTKIIRMARCISHRVYRVPGFLSSRPNWVPPTPQASVAPPLIPLRYQLIKIGRGVLESGCSCVAIVVQGFSVNTKSVFTKTS